jgi:hypothetical protein
VLSRKLYPLSRIALLQGSVGFGGNAVLDGYMHGAYDIARERGKKSRNPGWRLLFIWYASVLAAVAHNAISV